MVKNGKGEIESLKPTENLKRWGAGRGRGLSSSVYTILRGGFFLIGGSTSCMQHCTYAHNYRNHFA